ncbi:unnamed protein product [Brassicogethes aeneus]|uniref:EGF-like domain-containing protein n=1 Tax=Brassicogethes aeneus TaxID=1431903 RepID=A0A9P0FPM4_BRAAE|nr:unnamed protein product [Brassicogethes aeneus]
MYHMWSNNCVAMKWVFLVTIFLFTTGIQGLNEKCDSSTTCTTINSKCIENKCICDALSYLSVDKTKCLTYATAYKDFCQEDDQCKAYEQSFVCTKNKCTCGDGKYWYKGKCLKQANLNEHCEQNDECYNGYDVKAMTCGVVTKKCECNGGYYLRDGIDCRKISTSLCSIDLDCIQAGTGNKCNLLGKCENPTKHIEEENINNLIELTTSVNKKEGFSNCTENMDCDDLNSKCEESVCQCLPGFTRIKGSCLPGFSSCSIDKDCKIENSMCLDLSKTCICKKGYFLRDGKCVGEIGATCKNSNECSNVFASCATSTCSCLDNAYTNDEFKECTKNICLSDIECGKYSSCVGTKCICNEGYKKINDKVQECSPVHGGICLYDSCPEGMLCIAGTCQCSGEYVLSLNKSTCIKVANKIGDACDEPLQCSKFNFAECSKEKKCACQENCVYVEEHGNCYINKSYSTFCSKNFECTFVLGDDFVCRSNVCQCHIGSVYKNNKCTSSSDKIRISVFMLCILSIFFVF